MRFISEFIINDPLYKPAATGFAEHHILIKPLSRPNTSLGHTFDVKSCFLPSKFRQYADDIYDFKVKIDDEQDIVWLILNHFNFDKAKNIQLEERTSFLEQSAVQHPQLFQSMYSVYSTRRANEPRIFKSHLPVALLPKQLWIKKPKIICAMRNPGDMSKLYYEQYYHLHGYQGTYEEFCTLLMADRVLYSPYLSHLTEMWRMKEIFIQKFDELAADFELSVRRLVEFLGKTISEKQMIELKEYFSISGIGKINTTVTNKLWKRKTDTPSPDVCQINSVVEIWARTSLNEFNLQLNYLE